LQKIKTAVQTNLELLVPAMDALGASRLVRYDKRWIIPSPDDWSPCPWFPWSVCRPEYRHAGENGGQEDDEDEENVQFNVEFIDKHDEHDQHGDHKHDKHYDDSDDGRPGSITPTPLKRGGFTVPYHHPACYYEEKAKQAAADPRSQLFGITSH
jgi:hypothetical protein